MHACSMLGLNSVKSVLCQENNAMDLEACEVSLKLFIHVDLCIPSSESVDTTLLSALSLKPASNKSVPKHFQFQLV